MYSVRLTAQSIMSIKVTLDFLLGEWVYRIATLISGFITLKVFGFFFAATRLRQQLF